LITSDCRTREINSSAHKRTEGRAPVWGSVFTTKAAPKGGGQQKWLLGYNDFSAI